MNIKNILVENLSYNSIFSTPINQILRYHPIISFIKKLRKKNNLNILEVGSGGAGITKFVKLPVTSMDIEFDNNSGPYIKKILHSAIDKFPFKDNEFDVVMSIDCYEHLPKNKRKKNLEEMYRVSKKYILITTIFSLHKWHKKILETWNKKSKIYQAILEHKHAGFPDVNEVYNFLKGKNYQLKIINGTHPRLAYFLNLTEENIITMILSRTILKLFLPVFKLYKGKNRIYFFIKKNN